MNQRLDCLREAWHGGLPLVSDMQYRPFGPVESIAFDNGQTLTKDWDQNYWPDAVASPAFSYDFATDPVGNIIRIDSSTDPTRDYGYDRLDRLTNVQAANQSPIESYGYDAAGNRTSRVSGGAPETYSYANTPPTPVLPGSPGYGDYSHRLQSVGATPRTYDEVGNTLTGIPALNAQGAQAEYDVRNRMTGLRVAASSYIARYEYNGRGERVAKHVGTDALLYLFDQSGQLLGRYTANTNPGSTWSLDEELVWLDNTPIASVRIESGQPTVRAILTDHLNTPRALTVLHGGNQPAGTSVWRWSLTSKETSGNNAFGTDVVDEDPDGNGTAFRFDLRFPGQQYDLESGTHHNYFRDYDYSIGRYLTPDPMGQLANMTLRHVFLSRVIPGVRLRSSIFPSQLMGLPDGAGAPGFGSGNVVSSVFAYSDSLPINFVDPLGLAPNPATGRAAAIFAGRGAAGLGMAVLPLLLSSGDPSGTECLCELGLGPGTQSLLALQGGVGNLTFGAALAGGAGSVAMAGALMVGSGGAAGYQIGRGFNYAWSYYSDCQSSLGTWIYEQINGQEE